MWKRSIALLTLVVLLSLSVSSPGFAQDETGEIHLTYLSFDKSAIEEGVWEGQVAGDVVGDLRTELRTIETVGPIWFVEFDWIVDAPDATFTARLTGTLNTTSGLVVMTGEVIEGDFMGARVYEQGQLVDPGANRFQGTIMVMENG